MHRETMEGTNRKGHGGLVARQILGGGRSNRKSGKKNSVVKEWPSSLLALPSQSLPVPYRLAHTSNTTNTSLYDEFLIEIHSIGQDQVPKRAPLVR